jgi:diguanylate cyclase (GGDEF)-like protein
MDMYMPGASGIELAQLIRQQEAYVGIPIVFLSIETDVEKQLEAISHGGDDFLVKPIDPQHLIKSVTIRAERTRNMRFFMERDSLTGLLNHSNLIESLNTEVQRAERIGNDLCFAMIDIDHFKSVNDSYGHLTGDRVLKGLARLLQERLRKTDIIGRYGGEEFGVILFNTEEGDAGRILDEIRESFSKIRQYSGSNEFFVTFSCGIASLSKCKDAGSLNHEADKALYEAKEEGRNRIVTG